MKQEIMYLSYFVSYTLFYHGLYYCPFMSKKFNSLILKMHGKYV